MTARPAARNVMSQASPSRLKVSLLPPHLLTDSALNGFGESPAGLAGYRRCGNSRPTVNAAQQNHIMAIPRENHRLRRLKPSLSSYMDNARNTAPMETNTNVRNHQCLPNRFMPHPPIRRTGRHLNDRRHQQFAGLNAAGVGLGAVNCSSQRAGEIRATRL
jgi:hypothetical protein